jgi:hypothetical protein
MRVLKETTDWATPNHTYFVSDDKSKLFAYIKSTGVKVEEFKKPIKFSVSHRKFKEIANTFGYSREEEAEVLPGTEYRVAGSGKNVYSVRDDRGAWSCTCPASKWQKGGECKHIKQIKSQSQKSPA